MSPARSKRTGETTTCPWCSSTVPLTAATCPSCGASLRDAADGDILGVTQIDPGAISRASRIKPGRIASLLGAEAVDVGPDLGGRVEPPSKEVREEMLRLELAALDAEIEAKAAQAAAERELEGDGAVDASATLTADAAAEPAAGDASDAADATDAGDAGDATDAGDTGDASESKPG